MFVNVKSTSPHTSSSGLLGLATSGTTASLLQSRLIATRGWNIFPILLSLPWWSLAALPTWLHPLALLLATTHHHTLLSWCRHSATHHCLLICLPLQCSYCLSRPAPKITVYNLLLWHFFYILFSHRHLCRITFRFRSNHAKVTSSCTWGVWGKSDRMIQCLARGL